MVRGMQDTPRKRKTPNAKRHQLGAPPVHRGALAGPLAWVAAGMAIATMAVAAWRGSFAAAGADASGYLNEARLWAGAGLHVCPDVARDVGWPDGGWTFAPLGFRPATRPGCIVPTYSPGLPITMAIASVIGGDRAAYAVVPLTGGLLVWMTFVLGRRLSSAGLGIGAALLVTTSPAFLYQLLQPMSDVPVAAGWVTALVLALRGTALSAGGAGLAASMAVLTRPNLALLAVPVACVVVVMPGFSLARLKPGSTSLLAFALGLLPGIAAVALVNAALYGGPLHSGYGTLAELYDLRSAPANLLRYARWLSETQTPLVFVGLLAPLFAAHTLVLVGFVCAVWASYIFYFVFDEWTYLRFLLPALPVMIVSSLWTVRAFGAVLRKRRVTALVLALVVPGLGWWQLRQAAELGVFAVRRDLIRYEMAGKFAGSRLPRAAFVAGEHSGSLWYYTGQPIVRWDLIPPESLDRTLEDLRARGLTPHLVLEAWEVPQFRQRFAGASAIGALDWPATAEVRHRIRVRIFSVADRARYLEGATIRTRMVW